ncbi:glycosyltransferase family 87 protein [Ferrovum sp.]|uniref:glycosyltransferase family 87 protein n=1 Tax=Ferrovum sp. TaxID=2609467 RepID=UPI00262D2FC3|nr:glycosyltransferase family 87 protein [Ferrovum sp.]
MTKTYLRLDPSQVTRLGAIGVGIYGAIALFFVGFSSTVSKNGFLMVSDLSVYWAAAVLALQGRAGSAYQEPILHATLVHFVPTVKGHFGWFYPPAYYLLILPLGFFPHYFPAFLAWILPTLGAWVKVLRRYSIRPSTFWFLGSFGGVWLNFLHGQNGFLTAALCGAALWSMRKNSGWTGAWVGLLAMKPQLGLVFPFVLLLNRAWRDLAMAALVVLLSNGIAVAILGGSVFWGWWQGMDLARHLMEQDGLGSHYWFNMPTVYAQLRLFGVSSPTAYGIHWALAAVSWGWLALMWKRTVDWRWRGAALILVSLMTSPYLMDYDLIWLGYVLVILLENGQTEGWYPGERWMVLVIWALPVAGRLLVEVTHVQIAPLVLWLAMGMIWRRVTRLEGRNFAISLR